MYLRDVCQNRLICQRILSSYIHRSLSGKISFINKYIIIKYNNVVKQNHDKCFTENLEHGRIKLQKRSGDYGTSND